MMDFFVGVFVGTNIGVLVAALLFAAGENSGGNSDDGWHEEADGTAGEATGEVVYLPDRSGNARGPGAGQQLPHRVGG